MNFFTSTISCLSGESKVIVSVSCQGALCLFLKKMDICKEMKIFVKYLHMLKILINFAKAKLKVVVNGKKSGGNEKNTTIGGCLAGGGVGRLSGGRTP